MSRRIDSWNRDECIRVPMESMISASEQALAQDIGQAPDRLIELILSKYSTLGVCAGIAENDRKLLLDNRILTNEGLTPFGKRLAYHANELDRQSDPTRLSRLLEGFPLTRDDVVLDVGCGAGQTLLLMAQLSGCSGVGIDMDTVALAFGKRILEMRQIGMISLLRAHGEALRFASASFSHVVSRVSLNYMHQKRALKEMVRVLRPGGCLLCQFEGLGMDLKMIAQAPSHRERASLAYDLSLGLVAQILGVQIAPGNSRLSPGRAFVSEVRIRSLLSRLGMRIRRCTVLSTYVYQTCGMLLVAEKS